MLSATSRRRVVSCECQSSDKMSRISPNDKTSLSGTGSSSSHSGSRPNLTASRIGRGRNGRSIGPPCPKVLCCRSQINRNSFPISQAHRPRERFVPSAQLD
jgi:hypothetical protein